MINNDNNCSLIKWNKNDDNDDYDDEDYAYERI